MHQFQHPYFLLVPYLHNISLAMFIMAILVLGTFCGLMRRELSPPVSRSLDLSLGVSRMFDAEGKY